MIFGSLSLFLFLGLCISYLFCIVLLCCVGYFSFFGVLGFSLFFADLLVFDMFRCHLVLFLCSCFGGFVPVSVLLVDFAGFLCFLGLY